MMKKFLAMCIPLLLIVVLAATPALAAGSVSISLSASSKSVNSGDTVTITVSATVDSCGSGGIDISYDSAVFQLVESKCLLSNTALSGSDVFAFENNTAISGKAFSITLKVKDSAALGSSGVTVKFKADSKTASKTVNITVACNHTYSNSCDTSCNSCGATRTIKHSWNTGKVSKEATCTSSGTKDYKCKVCGETKTEKISKAAHTYDNDCDTTCNVCGGTREITHAYVWALEGTGHIQKCSVCGVTQAQGEHTLESAVSGDASGHGYKCSICGLIPDAQAHIYDTDCDTDCNSCGYIRTITHAYSDKWTYDASGHWYECMICGEKMETVAHTPGEAATETTDQLCLDCGYVIQPAGNHTHTMAGDWLSNDVGHWFLCACLSYTEPEAHSLSEGTTDVENGIISYQCTVCGYVISEEIPQTEPTVEPTTDPSDAGREIMLFDMVPLWIVLAALLGVSLIANLVFIICIAASKKRGKFSS